MLLYQNTKHYPVYWGLPKITPSTDEGAFTNVSAFQMGRALSFWYIVFDPQIFTESNLNLDIANSFKAGHSSSSTPTCTEHWVKSLYCSRIRCLLSYHVSPLCVHRVKPPVLILNLESHRTEDCYCASFRAKLSIMLFDFSSCHWFISVWTDTSEDVVSNS